MGIQGLLPLLKSIHKPTHLRNFAGKTIGIDAYGWLHRGTVACAIDLAQGKPTRKYADFAMNRVRMLIHFGIKPYLVFDGDYLPSKAHTEKDRAARREESRRAGLQLLQAGKTSEAQQELQKAVDVTPLMAREMIEDLKAAGIPYVVAPYEADSQLTYLEQQGLIQGVLSEDSDLLVFGVRCLLTKLDQYGECVMIRRDDFTACREISLIGWKLHEFRMMAMLSGCDYLPGIDKMGLKTAYRLVRKHKAIERVIRSVQFDGKMKVPAGYLDSFTKAERTFLYQWVFCPEAKSLVNLTKVPSDVTLEEMPYIGLPVDPEVACGVAAGDLDPNTKLPLRVATRPDLAARRSSTIQTPSQKPGKPIAEFFKPRRTPLAELDPNSFTPSPSQRRLLESQSGTSWSASQIPPIRPPTVSRVASMAAPYSAPHPARRTVSAQLPSGRSPPKRQRLCSESTASVGANGARALDSTASRFFGASPSLRKASSKKDDFELWSDEATHEAMASLADTPAQSPSPKKRKRLSVFSDASVVGQDTLEDKPSQGASQPTVLSFSSSVTSTTQDTDTPATSFEGVGNTPSIFSRGVSSRFGDFKSKWSFEPDVKAEKAQGAAPLESQTTKEKSGSTESLEPRVRNDPTWDDHVVPASSPAGGDEAEEEGADQLLSDEQWLALERQPTEAEDEPDVEVKGSEDLIVPDSPCSNTFEGASRPSLDLGRFAFAG